MENAPSLVELPHKPGLEVAYRLIQNNPTDQKHNTSKVLIVFINGLMLPMSAWAETIRLLLSNNELKGIPAFSILTYDRYGQGGTKDRDPTDDPSDPSHGHDILSSVIDLHHLLNTIIGAHFDAVQPPELLFAAHSIGVPVARLYCTTYPRTVSALLFLASNMANSDMLSIFPDQSSPTFSPDALPQGVTASDLQTLRTRISQTFHPSVGSAEGLSRRNLPTLLPCTNAPKLLGPGRNPGSGRGSQS